MTEDQAIKRIEDALTDDRSWNEGYAILASNARRAAAIAWDEMKAIALEQRTLPAGWHPTIDGNDSPKAWDEYRRAKARAAMR